MPVTKHTIEKVSLSDNNTENKNKYFAVYKAQKINRQLIDYNNKSATKLFSSRPQVQEGTKHKFL